MTECLATHSVGESQLAGLMGARTPGKHPPRSARALQLIWGRSSPGRSQAGHPGPPPCAWRSRGPCVRRPSVVAVAASSTATKRRPGAAPPRKGEQATNNTTVWPRSNQRRGESSLSSDSKTYRVVMISRIQLRSCVHGMPKLARRCCTATTATAARSLDPASARCSRWARPSLPLVFIPPMRAVRAANARIPAGSPAHRRRSRPDP